MGPSVVWHPSSLPHAETFGLSPWAQWGLIGVIVLIGAWLALDVRGAAGRQSAEAEGTEEHEEPLVVGRRSTRTSPPDPLSFRGEGESTAMRVSSQRDKAPSPQRERELGGELGTSYWLNPIGVLTAILGIGAGVVALDRARAIMAISAVIKTHGTVNVSRLAVGLVVLFCVGGALAMPAPRLATAVFLAAGGVGVFLATAARWESRLKWWGAGYATTGWDNLWGWAALAFGLAVLAFAGWLYAGRGRREASRPRGHPGGEEARSTEETSVGQGVRG